MPEEEEVPDLVYVTSQRLEAMLGPQVPELHKSVLNYKTLISRNSVQVTREVKINLLIPDPRSSSLEISYLFRFRLE